MNIRIAGLQYILEDRYLQYRHCPLHLAKNHKSKHNDTDNNNGPQYCFHPAHIRYYPQPRLAKLDFRYRDVKVCYRLLVNTINGISNSTTMYPRERQRHLKIIVPSQQGKVVLSYCYNGENSKEGYLSSIIPKSALGFVYEQMKTAFNYWISPYRNRCDLQPIIWSSDQR